MPKILFHTVETKLFLSHRKRLRNFIISIFQAEEKEIERINYIFCSDKYLLELNRRFLKHDFYTDIITFDLSEGPLIRAEIYISADRVISNARLFKVSKELELLRVIFHGVLHLCGYKDKNSVEIAAMRQKENFYIEEFKKQKLL